MALQKTGGYPLSILFGGFEYCTPQRGADLIALVAESGLRGGEHDGSAVSSCPGIV